MCNCGANERMREMRYECSDFWAGWIVGGVLGSAVVINLKRQSNRICAPSFQLNWNPKYKPTEHTIVVIFKALWSSSKSLAMPNICLANSQEYGMPIIFWSDYVRSRLAFVFARVGTLDNTQLNIRRSVSNTDPANPCRYDV